MARRHPCRALFPVLQVDGGRADFGPAAQVKEVAAKKKRRRTAPPTINLYQSPGLAARLPGRLRIAGLPIGQQA
jgi:hypothetical protein